MEGVPISSSRRRGVFKECLLHKDIVVTALVLSSLAACSDLRAPATASSRTEFGDYGYSDIYRYYGGPSAASQEADVQRQQGRHITEKR